MAKAKKKVATKIDTHGFPKEVYVTIDYDDEDDGDDENGRTLELDLEVPGYRGAGELVAVYELKAVRRTVVKTTLVAVYELKAVRRTVVKTTLEDL